MCGRYTLTASPRAVASLFDLRDLPDVLRSRYNVAPSQLVAVVGTKPDGSGRGLVLMSWGLIPHWMKGPKPTAFINARSESAAEKPAFRDCYKRRRCLIPADGFYEWSKVGSKKQPYYFRRKDGTPLAYGGLWDSWADPETGEKRLTCCILTTAANELVKPFHERMPLVIEPNDFGVWLDPDVQRADELTHLLRPFPAEQMEAFPVSPKVNNARYDAPDCLAPAA